MHQIRLAGRGREAAEPAQDLFTIGVGGERVDPGHGGPHRHDLTQHLELARAVLERATARSRRLESDEEHRRPRIRQALRQVVQDPAPRGHPARGDDDRRPAHRVDGSRLLLGPRDVQLLGRERLLAGPERPGHLGVIVLRMSSVDLGHLDRHRAVEVHRERWHAPGPLQAVQHPQQLLRAIHGERGHHDHAAALRRVAHDARQLVLRGGRMGTVTVGRLEQQHVGGGDGLRIAQDGPVVAPEIAREHQPHGTHGQLDGRRAQNVPGAPEHRRRAVRHGKRRVVPRRPDEPQRGVGVIHGVQRQRRLVLRVPVAVRPLGVLLLQVRSVRQHDAQQVRRARRAVDGPAEPLPDEERQVPRVVDVRVTQHHRVEACGIGEPRLPVAQPQRFQPLEQAAVEQDAAVAGDDEVHRSRHGPGGAEELKRGHAGQSPGDYFSRATVGVANVGRGTSGSPRCSRARFRASSMLPWMFSSPSSSYIPDRSSATTG